MRQLMKKYYSASGISERVYDLSLKIEDLLHDRFAHLERIKEINQLKVLQAMQETRLSDIHFHSSTGYGYNDIGREKLEEIYAEVFSAEAALVRPTIVNGTHALTLCLQALLGSGDRILSVSGKPYDTLDQVIGIKEHPLSLVNLGVEYDSISLTEEGFFNFEKIEEHLRKYSVKMVYVQRSKGYARRRSLTISDIEKLAERVRSCASSAIIMVDNCYGEFIDIEEPTDVGADIMAGSLIKNPGGGLAITGGYIAGKRELVERVAERLTSPGIGRECGLTFGTTRLTLQGLFFAPQVVNSALKGAIFCSKLFMESGRDVFPLWNEERSDIIQAVGLDSEEEIIAFCRGVQAAAPVDSFVYPEPWEMPGYDSKVIMAAGAFIQGSSIELSADAPIREPYTVYFQGGLTYEHSKIGALAAYQNVKNLNR